MSYTPNTWANGDVITSAKLNNMEQGIANAGGGGGVLIANMDGDGKLDVKAGALFAAVQAGVVLVKIVSGGTEYCLLGYAYYEDGEGYYFAAYVGAEEQYAFEAATADDYPTIQA